MPLTLVPGSAPTNVVVVFSTRDAEVNWMPVDEMEWNGEIVYEIFFQPVPVSMGVSLIMLNTTNMSSATVSGLTPHVTYNVTIRARTVIGPGPSSAPVQGTTLQARKYSLEPRLHGTTFLEPILDSASCKRN